MRTLRAYVVHESTDDQLSELLDIVEKARPGTLAAKFTAAQSAQLAAAKPAISKRGQKPEPTDDARKLLAELEQQTAAFKTELEKMEAARLRALGLDDLPKNVSPKPRKAHGKRARLHS
jgi:hypothetical protein